MLNTLQLAINAKKRADEFAGSLKLAARKPILHISFSAPVFEENDMRRAFLKGFLAALEELRRSRKETPTHETVQA